MPQDVQVALDAAGTLGVVVGTDRSVLNHIPSDRNPPYMVSLGNEDRDEPFVFYVAGDQYSEALWRNTISPDAAREAMRHFATTGELSPAVAWVEVSANLVRAAERCFKRLSNPRVRQTIIELSRARRQHRADQGCGPFPSAQRV